MTAEEIAALFVPELEARRQALATGGRLVHYTTAEAAYKIIQGREVWLRNASMMNDFSEIQHGIDCLVAAWHSDAGVHLKELLNRLKQGLCDEIASLFDSHTPALRLNIYIISLSEHDDDEDKLGRLSMWRAYGKRAGVALVLNNSAFVGTTDAMQVFSSPVSYFGVDAFRDWFSQWVARLGAAEAQLRAIPPDNVQALFLMVFRNFALCTKHPGFQEEREWRVFHSDSFEGQSEWIRTAVEVVGGLPQHVTKLSLHDNESKGIVGVAPASLINRIIIGPCEHPLHVRVAIAGALKEAGVDDPLGRMWISFIPLRHG